MYRICYRLEYSSNQIPLTPIHVFYDYGDIDTSKQSVGRIEILSM